jgi:hypothetical protein
MERCGSCDGALIRNHTLCPPRTVWACRRCNTAFVDGIGEIVALGQGSSERLKATLPARDDRKGRYDHTRVSWESAQWD